ncbi:PHP domain-containing protein [Waterburya agarophytonicola K14]|uniref:PHP domain-containing protein n=1 Tax=Waterburya agarophytonicola KI4 TaxID=2874699 RepID=A0A964BV32_9CYAN|nr:PHP domain-containing protein [Waterburya agarophytonicola KI4]
MVATTYSLKPKAQDTIYLKSVWETINYISCPYSFNFHMHTQASDGQLTPLNLVQQAIAIGLKAFAITDHHTVDGYRQAEQYLSQLSTENNTQHIPHLWTGVEITSRLLGVEVHILGYGFDPQDPAIKSYLGGDKPQGEKAAAKKVIDSIHQAGGLVVLAHPERYRHSASKLIPAVADLGIDGVETYYAYNNPKTWQPSPKQTEKVRQLANRYGLYSTCGTDTHGLNLLQRI